MNYLGNPLQHVKILMGHYYFKDINSLKIIKLFYHFKTLFLVVRILIVFIIGYDTFY